MRVAVPQRRSARRRFPAVEVPPSLARPESTNEFRFYLGTHRPGWLAHSPVPLFVSYRTLSKRKRMPHAVTPWALDSGGFTELTKHGRWTIEPERYADDVRRIADETGSMRWAAIQDWMCEPAVLHGGKVSPKERAIGTGLTVEHHQLLTCLSLVRLRELAPEVHWLPVLQGWGWGDHMRHVDLYRTYGVDLTKEPLVGLGSVCRRQTTIRASAIIRWLSDEGIRLHGFGFKSQGLPWCARWLASADSLAWSYQARMGERLDVCTHQAGDCRNCMLYAVAWRQRALNAILRERLERPSGRVPRLPDEVCQREQPCSLSTPECWPCRLHVWRIKGAPRSKLQ